MDGTSSGLDEHLGGTSLAGGGLGVGSKGWLGLGWLGNLKGGFCLDGESIPKLHS